MSKEVFKDFLAYLLVSLPDRPAIGKFLCAFKYPGIGRQRDRSAIPAQQVFATRRGIGLAHEGILSRQKLSRILILIQPRARTIAPFVPFDIGAFDATLVCNVSDSNRSRHEFVRDLHANNLPKPLKAHYRLLGARLVSTVRFFERLQELKYLRPRVKEALKNEWSDGTWASVSVGECDPLAVEISTGGANVLQQSIDMTSLSVELFLSPRGDTATSSQLVSWWDEFIGRHLIPFDVGKRKKNLKRAYELLGPYIKAHEAFMETSKA